jgi:hypothetical protein
MKTRITILFLCISYCTNAQLANSGFDSEEFQNFMNSTTKIVLTGDQEIDEQIMASVNKYWNFTPFEEIGPDAYKEEVESSDDSYLLPLLVIQQTEHAQFAWFGYGIVMGGKKSKNYSRNDLLIYVPLNRYYTEEKFDQAIYRIDFMVSTLNETAKWIRDEKINEKGKKLDELCLAHVNSNANKIATKTMLVPKEVYDYDPQLTKKYYFDHIAIKKYTFKYKILPIAEIQALAESAEADQYCLLVPAKYIDFHLTVFDLATHQPLAMTDIAKTISVFDQGGVDSEDIYELLTLIKKK